MLVVWSSWVRQFDFTKGHRQRRIHLPQGTAAAFPVPCLQDLGTYTIDVPVQDALKKVKVRDLANTVNQSSLWPFSRKVKTALTLHGTFCVTQQQDRLQCTWRATTSIIRKLLLNLTGWALHR